MIKNYLKIALRGFRKHKLFTLINIVGLSIGICASVVIYLIVHFDLTFDKFEKDSDRIYRVVSNFTFQGEKGYNSGVCSPLAEAAKNQVPAIEVAAPFFCLSQPNVFVQQAGKQNNAGNTATQFKKQDNVIVVDPGFFKIIDYKWLAGSPQTALSAPNQVVLTSKQAELYFPKTPYNEIIGKVVTYDTLKTSVSGIVESLTANTDFQFHDFISYSTALLKANK